MLLITGQLFSKETKTIYGKLVTSSGEVVRNGLISLGSSSIQTPVNKDGSFEFTAQSGDTLQIHTGSFNPKIWIVPDSKQDVVFPEIVLQAKARVWSGEERVISTRTEPILVMGEVTNDKAEPMEGASVHVINSFSGVATNEFGSFRIEVMPGDTLEIRSVGFKSQYFNITEDADAIYREVELELDTTMLSEIKVMPWLTKEMMSYENLPLDASEVNRMYLREKALYTDKTKFRTVSFNFAPLILKYIGKGIGLIGNSKAKKKQNRIDVMRQQVLENQEREKINNDSIR